ncbi:hypothetical protein ACJ41O_004381 [Fusarium nematophilum]
MDSRASKVNKGKTPAKRNSEARREQNRIASRNYREKRKQKLALLNQLLEPSDVDNIANLAESDDASDPRIQGGSGHGIPPHTSAAPADPLIPLDPSIIDPDIINVGSTQPSSVVTQDTWGDLPFSTVPIPSAGPLQSTSPNTLPHPFAPLNDAFGPATVNLWPTEPFRTPQTLLQFPCSMSVDDFPDPVVVEEVFADSPDPIDQETQASSTSKHDDDDAFHKVLNGIETLNIDQKRDLLRRLEKETQDSASRVPTQQRSSPKQFPGSWPPTRAQMEAVYFTKAIHRVANAGPTPLPTQYIIETGLFGAMFANCYALGMGGVEEILVDEGCSIFSVTPNEGHAHSQLSVVRPRFRSVAPDLRPTDLQLTFGHHPYIVCSSPPWNSRMRAFEFVANSPLAQDVIPFRSFRDNIIKALSHDPPLLDEDILCHDLLAGGFTCWGSGHNPLGMAAAVPWDARSWEPTVWFLLKYRHLAGGWDDEMWKSARWWHGVRGERIQTAQAMGTVDGTFGCSFWR